MLKKSVDNFLSLSDKDRLDFYNNIIKIIQIKFYPKISKYDLDDLKQEAYLKIYAVDITTIKDNAFDYFYNVILNIFRTKYRILKNIVHTNQTYVKQVELSKVIQ